MPIGIQEIAALVIVACIVGFTLYRRWRRSRNSTGGCSDCATEPTDTADEKPVRIFRRTD